MRVVLHGGFFKTGSTSLQLALTANRPALKAVGVLYPPTPSDAHFPDTQHSFLLSKALNGEVDECAGILREMRNAAESANCSTILLSSEIATRFAECPERFEPFDQLLRSEFDDREYHFVVREPIGYALSLYREFLSSGYCSFSADFECGRLASMLLTPPRAVGFFFDRLRQKSHFWDYHSLSEKGLVRGLAARIIKADLPQEADRHTYTSAEKVKDLSGFMLAPIQALIGQSLGQHSLAVQSNAIVAQSVDLDCLRRSIRPEAAARLREMYLQVTFENVKLAYLSCRRQLEQEILRLPEALRYMATPASTPLAES